jgi:hypothetical protein
MVMNFMMRQLFKVDRRRKGTAKEKKSVSDEQAVFKRENNQLNVQAGTFVHVQ